MVIVSGRIGRHCATPSTIQPVKTAPASGVTASVATAPARYLSPPLALPPPLVKSVRV